MDRRAPSLFKSPLMLCSIYLDPRISFKLCDEQRATAAMDLVKLYERITISRFNSEKGNRADDTLDEIQAEYESQHNEDQSFSNRIASFSSYSYIRNRYRMAMLPKNISNVLMVRLNKDIYKELRKERVQQILS